MIPNNDNLKIAVKDVETYGIGGLLNKKNLDILVALATAKIKGRLLTYKEWTMKENNLCHK
jgi:hypothetical protein